MLLPNKKKIKKSVPPIGMAGTKNKKNVTSFQPVTDWHVSGRGSFLPFETAGMRKTTKKKSPKNKSGSFWFFFFKGVILKICFGIRVRKKIQINQVLRMERLHISQSLLSKHCFSLPSILCLLLSFIHIKFQISKGLYFLFLFVATNFWWRSPKVETVSLQMETMRMKMRRYPCQV